jgi:hypothetical protein
MADFSCDGGSPQNSSAGIAYTQECGVYYQTNHNRIAPEPKSWVRNLPIGSDDKSEDPVTRYSFMDCINYCDEYNNAGQSPACYGVSYYANLTWAIQNRKWKGNCFLKNGRGEGKSDGDGSEDWKHTASAYKTCLNNGNTCPSDD